MKKRFLLKSVCFCIAAVFTLLFCVGCSSVYESKENASEGKEEILGIPSSGSLDSENPVIDSVNDKQDVYDRKVIRNATVRAETNEYEKAIEALKSTVRDFDGYVQSSSISGNSLSSFSNLNRTATLTLCIPADKLDSFLNQVDGILNVTLSQITEQDITNHYYDLASRLETLRSEKERLTKMLGDCNSVNEMLSIEERLYDVIEEIESKQALMNLYNTRIAYSTVTLTVNEVAELSKAEMPFGERISKAFSESWKGFGMFCQEFMIFIVSILPGLLLVFCIVGAIILIISLAVRHSNKKMNRMREAYLKKVPDETKKQDTDQS